MNQEKRADQNRKNGKQEVEKKEVESFTIKEKIKNDDNVLTPGPKKPRYAVSLQTRLTGTLSGKYSRNISDELIELLKNDENDEKSIGQEYYLYKHGNDCNNNCIGDFRISNHDLIDNKSDDGSDDSDDDLFSGIAQFEALLQETDNSTSTQSTSMSQLTITNKKPKNLVDKTRIYQQLKLYFKTNICRNMDKIQKVVFGKDSKSRDLLFSLLKCICKNAKFTKTISSKQISHQLLHLFFGELNTMILLSTVKKNRLCDGKIYALIQLLFGGASCSNPFRFASLVSTTMAIFFTKTFGIPLLNKRTTVNSAKRTVLVNTFDFAIANSSLYYLSPKLSVNKRRTVYEDNLGKVLKSPEQDQEFLARFSEYRKLWNEMRSINNKHNLLINQAHYKGESLIHYTCDHDMLRSTVLLIDEWEFDCDKIFDQEIGSAYSKSQGAVRGMCDRLRMGGGFSSQIGDDIDKVQQTEIDVSFVLLALGKSCNGYKSNVSTNENEAKQEKKENEKKTEKKMEEKEKDNIITTKFKRTNIDGDVVLDGMHKALLNLIDSHVQWDDFMFSLVDKYLRQCKQYKNINEKYHDLSVLALKTISMILSFAVSHLKSSQDLFRHKYQKSKALLSVLDINTLKYIKNTLINTEDCKVYLSDDCDERVGTIFDRYLQILVDEMVREVETIEESASHGNIYPSIGDLLAKFSCILQHETQKGLYDEIAHQVKMYPADWNQIRKFGKDFTTNDDGKLKQSTYSNPTDSSSPTPSPNTKQHSRSRNASDKVAQLLSGDDSIRPYAAAQEVKLQQLHKLAGELNESFHQTMELFRKYLGDCLIEYHRGPMKTQDRIRDKLESKPNSDIDNVLDINRGSIDCFSIVELNYALKKFKKFVGNDKHGMMKIVRVKNTTKNWLKNEKTKTVIYGDIKCNVLFGHGKKSIIGEIQFNVRDVIDFQRKIHPFYEIERLKKVFNRMKSMIAIYKLDDEKVYQEYNDSIMKASNTRAFCNSLMYSPAKLYELEINLGGNWTDTILGYLGDNMNNKNDRKRADMFLLAFDYLLYFKKHFVYSDPNYVSNYLVKRSFDNEPFYRDTAFGINCNKMKDNSTEFNALKHILDSISLPDDISINLDQICLENADLSQLYILWCRYLHHNNAMKDAIISSDFIASVCTFQITSIAKYNLEYLMDELKNTFGLTRIDG